MECTREDCHGVIEASAKVYFDAEAKRDPNGGIILTDLTFSGVNDEYGGHPVALEAELSVSCADCGHEFGVSVDDDLAERIEFQGLRA